jgi:hypothetical protein
MGDDAAGNPASAPLSHISCSRRLANCSSFQES